MTAAIENSWPLEYKSYSSPVQVLYMYWDEHQESCQCLRCTDLGRLFKQICNKEPNIWEITKDMKPVDRFLPFIGRLAYEEILKPSNKPQLKL